MDRYVHEFGAQNGWVSILSTHESFSIRVLGPDMKFLNNHRVIINPLKAYQEFFALNKVMEAMKISMIMDLRVKLDFSELVRGIKFRITTREPNSIYFGSTPIEFESLVIAPPENVIIPIVIGGEKKSIVYSNAVGARDREAMSEKWKPIKVIFV